MKFRVDRDVMADAVVWASRSLPNKSTQPLLTGVHLVADKTGLTFSGSDADVSARANITADVAEPGTVLIPGRLLADITRSLPSAAIEFSIDGSRAHITCGRSSFSIPTMPVADYPPIPTMPQISGTIAGAEFAAAIAQVVVASSRDETLPPFTGIKIDIDGSTMTMAATDRYRLAVRELEWSPASPSLSTHALVPAKFLSETAKALSHSASIGLAFTSTSEGLVGIEGEGRQTTSRLLAADFPKYQSLLPSESSSVAQINTGQLIEAVKRVSLVLDRDIPVRIHFTNGEAAISGGGGNGEIAEAREYVECALSGDELTIAFNYQFLLDGLGAIDAPTAVISMTTPIRPAVITGAKEVDAPPYDSFKYLLMPIRQP
ncbi:MAG: DNA polymerase III subunit beta [Actinomycetes bacterium]